MIKVTNAILSFPTLFTPKGFAGDPTSKPAYSASFLIERGSDNEKTIRAAMLAAAKAKFSKPGEAEKQLAQLEKQEKTCLRDGDLKSFDGYEGRLYLAARSPTKPLLVGRDPFLRNAEGQIVQENGRAVPNLITEEQGLLYGGAIVTATVEIYFQDSQYGKRVNAQLRGIQWVGHGEAFGKSAPKAEEFEVLDSAGVV